MKREPVLTEYSKMTGFFNFDDHTVAGDAFKRYGHIESYKMFNEFYCKSVDNLSTCEGQHAAADYKNVLAKGISGIIGEIDGCTYRS